MSNKSFKNLIVWQKSIVLVTEIYRITSLLPEEEKYGISSQMKRAAVSIPSNIAEGAQRQSKKEFINFLYYANGSKAELQTQCYICVKLGFLSKNEITPIMNQLTEIGKMLYSMIGSLKNSAYPDNN